MERNRFCIAARSGKGPNSMKSTDVLSERRKRIWNIVRHVVPPRPRWYFEGHPRLRGQLWYGERKLLYETVRRYRPANCFEIGTWRGGGSTLFISQALHDNGKGMLHTVEIDGAFYQEAVANYNEFLPHLVPHVTFHLGDFKLVYSEVLRQCGKIDFLILDGAEDARQTLDQYEFFLPFILSGSVLMVHDWFSEKTRSIKPILEQTDEWDIQRVLAQPNSLGFILAIRK
jgi:hypothetical protein